MRNPEGSLRIAKIKYSVNLLPQVGWNVNEDRELLNQGVLLSSILASVQHIDELSTPPVETMIKFKWDLYGKKHHLYSLWFHALYTLIVIIYVKEVNMVENDDKDFFCIAMAVGLIYSFL